MREEQTSRNLDRAFVGSVLSAAKSGKGAVLLYEGAAQTGKTWVLGEVLGLAADAGFATTRLGAGEHPAVAAAERAEPAVVAIDDVHRASPGFARELLAMVATGTRTVWVLARESGAGCPEVERLCQVLGGTRSELVPWTEDETAGYLADRLHAEPDLALTRLANTAGGNPALLEALVDGLSHEGFVEVGDGRARLAKPGLPESVLPAVLDRVLRLCGEQLARDALVELTRAALPAGDLPARDPRETMARATEAWCSGELSRGLRLAYRAISESGRLAVDERPAEVEIAAAVVLADASRFDECDTILATVRDRMRWTGQTRWEAPWSAAKARRLAKAGRLRDAVAVVNGHDSAELSSPELAVLALAALRDGDIAKSARYVRRCKLIEGDPAEYGSVVLQLAEAQYGHGHALSLFKEMYGTGRRLRELLVREPAMAALIVRVALCGDDLPTARWVCELIGELAEDDLPAFRAADLHARGLSRRDTGLLSQARLLYADSWSRARVVEDLADIASPRTANALQEALSLYSEAAAARDFARVRSRLRSVGVYDTYARFSGIPGATFRDLTDKQESIVRLVADGLTNHQIANQVFVTTHTVNFHLRKIFRKTGVNSRVELAALYKSWASSELPRSG
ncbi:helix-turn-helix domain-containing protein [Amycolatopsis alba]|nr:helix-turn-helix transcriptional regulator [Amycolatopsis alba]